MRTLSIAAAAALLPWIFFCGNALAQGGNGTLTGTVEDATKALVPGVKITALNSGTGVETVALTNESGVYNILSLLPGVYKLTAELSGFRTGTFTNIELATNESKRFNFTLAVAGAISQVDVTIDATNLLTAASATIGEVLPMERVRDLPLVGNNVLDLIGVMGGARVSALGGDFTTFAGITGQYINTTVNGQSVGDGRYANGVYGTTRINPDMVGEIRLILTPVDAELGRGNGQVQIQTRSGTNQFRGTVVENARNTALDARRWIDNRTVPLPARDWQNQHEFSGSYGGPIIQNKTFFYALWDQQITRSRTTVTSLVLTDCARNGIFRYFPDWNNGNYLQPVPTIPTTSQTAVLPIVDPLGNPVTPTQNRNGNPYTGSLQFVSVFGRVTTNPIKPDCSDAVVTPGTAWDANRPIPDQTGFVKKTLDSMPHANAFDGGDGLNTANFRWVRRQEGNDSATGATSDNTNRKQFNIRIDHNFGSNKISGNWSYERNDSGASPPAWPNGFWGSVIRRPQVLTLNFTSTLSPRLLNEARFGVRYNRSQQLEAMDDPNTGKAARSYFPSVNGIPVFVGLGAGSGITSVNFQSSVASSADFSRGNTTPLWTFGDTLSFTRGRHVFKVGAELRFDDSNGFSNLNLIPRATGGAGQVTLPTFSNSLSGFLSNNNTEMGNLLTFLSGSIGNVTQLYFLQNGTQRDKWSDIRDGANRYAHFRQNEWDAFFKDDWKVSKNVTLNLGLRYEYYGSPWEVNGLTMAPAGGGFAAFGYSGRSFTDWFKQGQRGDDLTFTTVGPNSSNPGKSLWPADRNNFGPAVGFAWQVPWFGEGKTTVRGGYQITYQGGDRSFNLDLALGYAPGTIVTPAITPNGSTYVTLNDLEQKYLPVPTALAPFQTAPNTYRATYTGWSNVVYDPNYATPYVQNFTLSVTRSVRRNMTMDVRYIGTKGTKLFGNLPLNNNNFQTNGLKDALDAARYGQDSPLLDRIFSGINIAGTGCDGIANSNSCAPVGQRNAAGVLQTGAMHLRASSSFQSNLANGNYASLAGTLNTLNYNRTFSGNSGLPVVSDPSVVGTVLRYNNFSENFIATNPQFSNGFGLATNPLHSTYHALQTQFTVRPTHGFSYQGTFTWSKLLGNNPLLNGWQDPTDRIDNGLLWGHRSYDFRSNGGIELPIGPNKLLLGNSSGWLARLTERWQLSVISQFTSGRANNIAAQNMLYSGSGTPVVTPEGVAYFGSFPHDFGGVNWPDGAQFGSYFPSDMFVRVTDPQCGMLTTLNGLKTSSAGVERCTLQALARPLPTGTTGVPGQMTLPDGRPGLIVLRNPMPGERGTLGFTSMEGPGLWLFDAAMSKTFRISENKSIQFRVDAKNLFNHPTPDDPGQPSCAGATTSLTLNSTTDFGRINGKCVAESAARRFQGSLRINF